MKVIFLGTNSFADKNGKTRYRVDIAYKRKDSESGYNCLVGFTTEKHYKAMLDIKPFSEIDMAVFFPDAEHKCNRIYTKS